MTDHNDNDNETADESAYPERSLESLMPTFGALAPLVSMLYNAHRDYSIAHAAKFGSETPKFTAWRESLDTSEIDSLVDTPESMADDYPETLVSLYDAVRFCPDAETVASYIAHLSELLTLARENLQGIYYGAKRAQNVDTSDVVALRATLDSFFTSVAAIAETPQLDMRDVSAIIPTRVKVSKNGAKRTVYAGESIPQTRKSDGLRSNARIQLVAQSIIGDPESFGDVAGKDFAEQLAQLNLSIGEMRTQYFADGVKFDVVCTMPSGRQFWLKRVESK